MKTVDLNPYLFFDGNCREAMEFYRHIFGGQLELLTYGQIDPNSPESKKNRIMHSNLMGGAVEFFGGDGMDASPLGTGKISMTLHGSDEEKLREIFEKLSEGGKIKTPIAVHIPNMPAVYRPVLAELGENGIVFKEEID